LQIAHRHQPIVSLDHGEAANLVAVGQNANRRELRSWPKETTLDLPFDASDDLIHERLPALLADGEGEHVCRSPPAAPFVRLDW
jgi:hypothetical protein